MNNCFLASFCSASVTILLNTFFFININLCNFSWFFKASSAASFAAILLAAFSASMSAAISCILSLCSSNLDCTVAFSILSSIDNTAFSYLPTSLISASASKNLGTLNIVSSGSSPSKSSISPLSFLAALVISSIF